jgi:predicted RNA-binding protein with PUA-like domain
MNYWLVKTEPDEYSYDMLEKDGRTVWQGVRNPQALKFMREMKPGDRVLIYHTGKEKQIVGLAEAVSGPHPDPDQSDEDLTVIDIIPKKRLKQPVTLAKIKSDDSLADLYLVRMSRLSVMAMPAVAFRKLLRMGGTAE